MALAGTSIPEEGAEPMGSGAQRTTGPRLGPPHIFSSPAVPYPFLLFSFGPTEPLPNVVVSGVLQGLYGTSNRPTEAQPEASCDPTPLPPMP